MEWRTVLEESSVTNMCPQLRQLFIVILMFCQPANPRELFEEFCETWINNFDRQGKSKKIELDRNQMMTMLLLDLEMRLQSFEKELSDFGLPKPTEEDLLRVKFIANTEPVLIREEKDYSVEHLSSTVQERIKIFTTEQLEIFEDILKAVKEDEPLCAFIDARGGCGKTFLLNAVLAAVRSLEQEGCVALAMATTGIAANLLSLGRTFHSRLKAPLIASEDSMLQISA